MTHIAHFELEAPYVHSTGPAVGRFLDGLRQQRIWGRRCDRCARVVVPATDHCETCGMPLTEWAEVGPAGTVRIVAEGSDGTTFACIRLDGAGTDLVHILDAGVTFAPGARVRPRWAAERTGSIKDIECFEARP